MSICLQEIGTIHTPYSLASGAPYQPVSDNDPAQRQFYVELDPAYAAGLHRLDSYAYLYLLFYVDRLTKPCRMQISPPWTDGAVTVGLFASRSPARPNPIGLSVVRLLSVEGARIYTSPLDVFDNTPLLDIKPYIRDLDTKTDANYGWIDDLPDKEHLMLHILGIPHEF
ncbi:MAG: tRNA (N6-threonylcarbamoyladenosine(37)-N6)-methyltransferase TrmO [Geobacteraceae bacterium]|nr:tRNA (N6-threonylcarbamoyladenosine(37)-N6)-methyltransferase TrmO [Geobacteraceae bacterium]